jgi:hypothetical protein
MIKIINRAKKRMFPCICVSCNEPRELDEFGSIYVYICSFCKTKEQLIKEQIRIKNEQDKKNKQKRLNYIIAHKLVNNAIREKKIIRPKQCSQCFNENKHGIVGHHNDYLEPFKITWLCKKCHVNWHLKNGKGKNDI